MNSNRKKLLVAVDSSKYSLDTVRYVANLFPPETMEVVLFHVLSKIPEMYRDAEASPFYNPELLRAKAWAAQQEKSINEFFEKARGLLMEQRIPVNAVISKIEDLKQGVARDILTESKQGYDAVVVGRRGLNPVSELILGSVSNKLLNKITHMPICAVGGIPRSGILVGLDASEGSMRAVDYVGRMFAGTEAAVTLMHVVRSFDYVAPELEMGLTSSLQEEIEADLRQAQDAMFKDAINVLRKVGFEPNRITSEIVSGVASRAETLVNKAMEYGIGTIVLGRRGLSNVEEFLMGRVSNKVLHLAKTAAVWVIN
ncbi:MAG: universal stress protein [Deltaproteobacteria bacterium]|nr:universal stress protein [Deltaproteobacteria bacterium]